MNGKGGKELFTLFLFFGRLRQGKDVEQGQHLSGAQLVWIQSFPSQR